MKIATPVRLAFGAALLLSVGAGLRRNASEIDRTTRPAPPGTAHAEVVVPPPEQVRNPTPSPRAPSDAELWDRMANLLGSRPESGRESRRSTALLETARYLQLERGEAEAFQAAARRAVVRVQDAWRARDEAWVATAGNLSLTEEERQEVERQIQDRYETEKRAALEGLEASLGEGPAARSLKGRLNEWIDTLW